MAKHTLKILRSEHRNIFVVCLAIFQYDAWVVKLSSHIFYNILYDFVKGVVFFILLVVFAIILRESF